MLSKTTPRRLRASLTAARRNSFYSGARSRNWERAKTQLLADHIRGTADRRSSDLGSQQTPSSTNFLFSDILSASQSMSPKSRLTPRAQLCRKRTLTPERIALDHGLDTCEDNDSDTKNINCVVSKLTLESPVRKSCGGVDTGEEELSTCLDLGHTPVKRVRRALLLGTPSKAVSNRSPGKVRSTPGSNRTSSEFSGFSTPRKNSPARLLDEEHLAAYTKVSGGSEDTHPDSLEARDTFSNTLSKKVHFTLKMNSELPQTPKRSGTPKSILKTPNKTPTKGSYCSPTVGSNLSGSWRDTTVTPCKGIPQEDGVHPSTPVVKLGSLVSHSESEFELLSPTKINRQDNQKYHSPEQSSCASRLAKSPRKLAQSPKKFRSRSSPSEVDENSETPFSSNRKLAKRLDDAKFDCVMQCDSVSPSPAEVDVSLLPYLSEEDINLLNTLLFGNLAGPDSLVSPVLETSEKSDLEQSAIRDDSEVCDSDDDDISSGSPRFPNLEATVALHSTPEIQDSECMSPILLPNLRRWLSQREDCTDWLDKLDYEKVVAGKTIFPFTDDTLERTYCEKKKTDLSEGLSVVDGSQETALEKINTLQDAVEDPGPVENIVRDFSLHNVTEDIGSLQVLAPNSASLSKLGKDAISSQDVAVDTISSQSVPQDIGSSEDGAEDAILSQVMGMDSDSSQDGSEDTSSSQNVNEDTSSLQDLGDDTIASQDVTEDTTSSHDVPQNICSSMDLSHKDDVSHYEAENTATSLNMSANTAASQVVADRSDSPHDVAKDTSSQKLANCTDLMQDSENTVSLQSIPSDVNGEFGITQNIVKTVCLLKDVDATNNINPQLALAKFDGLQDIEAEGFSSQNVTGDTESQGKPLLYSDASQVMTKDRSFLKDTAADGSTLQNMPENSCSVHSVDTNVRATPDRDSNLLNKVTEYVDSVLDSSQDSSTQDNSEGCISSKEKQSTVHSSQALLTIDQAKGNSQSEVSKSLCLSGQECALAPVKVNENVLNSKSLEEELNKSQVIDNKPNSSSPPPCDGGTKMNNSISKSVVKLHKAGKRRKNSSSDEQLQENVKCERVLRERRRGKSRESRKGLMRSCRRLVSSLRDLSSDESEEQEWCRPKRKKRIFEEFDFITPEKMKADDVTLPLKNVENLPYTQERLGHIGAAQTAEVMPEANAGETVNTPESCIERENSSVLEDASHMEQEPSISGSSLPNTATQGKSITGTSKWQPGKTKRKKKGVKLTLTRSGDQYQVTKTQISLGSSDPNSSCSDLNESVESSKSSTTHTTKKSKREKSFTLLTPHRFTRHMSRDLSVSPDFYQELITLSPHKSFNSPKMENISSKEKHSQSSVGKPVYASTPRIPKKSEEWWVSNLSDSPTLKTFVRSQKRKHQISVSPRVKLPRIHKEGSTAAEENEDVKSSEDWSPLFLKKKPMHYSSPSIQSLLQLSSDKILLDQSPDQDRRSSSCKKQQSSPLAGPATSASPNLKLRSSRRLLYSGLGE